MRFTITNSQSKKTYGISTGDDGKARKVVRKKVSDEEICSKCGKKLSECECKKEPAPAMHDEKVDLTEEQVEALKELIELLPDLKKILEESSEPKKPKKEKKEKEEKPEEKGEKPEEKGKEPKPEEPKGKTGDEDDVPVIFEGSGDDKEIVSEEFEFEEEDVLEDEGGNGVHDSVLNPGVVETKAPNSNKGAISHEAEVAEAWANRYEALLKTK